MSNYPSAIDHSHFDFQGIDRSVCSAHGNSLPCSECHPICEACDKPQHPLAEADGCAFHEWEAAIEDLNNMEHFSQEAQHRVYRWSLRLAEAHNA